MKKIITLFASVILLASAYAQHNGRDQRDYNHERNRDVAYSDRGFDKNDHRRGGGYFFSKRDRDIQVEQVNRIFDKRIYSVRNKWLMSHSKKQRIIWSLEEDRRQEIRKIYAKFNHPANRFKDHSGRNW